MLSMNAFLTDVNIGKKVVVKLEVLPDSEGVLPVLAKLKQSFVTVGIEEMNIEEDGWDG